MFAKGFGLSVIILLAIVILSLPYFLKDNNLPIGKDGYYYLRIAMDILNEKALPGYDKLIYSDRINFICIGWPILIALTSFIFGLSVEISRGILLFLLGILSAILFYNILRIFDLNVRFISSLVLVISPIYIYLFTEGGRWTVPFVLFLLLAYFVFDKKYLKAGITFFFIPFFDLISAFFIFAMLICYFLYIKRKRLFLYSLIFLLLILNFVFYKNFNFNFISDFGSKIGLSIFSVFLFFVGFGLFWRKKRFLLLYLICLILFLFYLKFSWLLIYLNLFLAILVTVCFIELFERGWESNIIKNMTLLLLVCGLLFSGLSYAKAISEDVPNEEFFVALGLIEDKAVVFSSFENRYLINYAGKRSVVESERRDFDDILMLRDAEITKFLLDKYNVEYILIDNKMEKDIWGGERKGLLWVLNYDTEHFINIYYGKYVAIWRYIGR